MKNRIYLLAIVAVLLSSCTTQNKVYTYMGKNQDFKLKYLAENCTVNEKETFIKGKDSIIEKEVIVKGDSIECPIVKGVVQKAKCPDARIVYKEILRVDTVLKQIENKSKLDYLTAENVKVNDLLAKEKLAHTVADKTAKTRLWYLIGLLSIIGLGIFLKVKKILPF